MEFFGMEVLRTAETLTIPYGRFLKVSQACLGIDVVKMTRVYVRTARKDALEVILCCLDKKTNSQCSLDLVFSPADCPISFWSDFSNVHITGYMFSLDFKTEFDHLVPKSVVTQLINSKQSKKRKASEPVDVCRMDPIVTTSAHDTSIADIAETTSNSLAGAPVDKVVTKIRKWRVKPQNDEGILVPQPRQVTCADGLIITDFIIGKGIEPKLGKQIGVTYEGMLSNGVVFDSNLKRTKPFQFRKGVGQVIRGLDLGLKGMRIGGAREIVIPAALGYGDHGLPGTIAGGSDLLFRVNLIS